MTFDNFFILFSILFVGALVLSVSSITVLTRSVASGFIHGVLVSLGIVLGDITFILIAIFGLTVVVDSMGELFFIIKYIGGAYLVWLGIALWRSKINSIETESVTESSLISSFLTGFIITLSDQKAIFFYLGLFPTLIDLSKITYFDISSILVITFIAVGSEVVKFIWPQICIQSNIFSQKHSEITHY